MIKIEIQVPEVVTVTIDDVNVVADNEAINKELKLFLGSLIENHSHALPSLEPTLADKVIELYGGKIVFREEVERESLPDDTVH